MASQEWDTAQSIRRMAEEIDHFLYVDGKTSPKVRELRKHTEKEYIQFLDDLRENLWEEQRKLFEDMGYDV